MKQLTRPEVVVITGASAGVGRATFYDGEEACEMFAGTLVRLMDLAARIPDRFGDIPGAFIKDGFSA